ncbi:MAG: hemagglutinin repeat-containing protein [Campylobacteraceae bacterium]|nr:hemagglutinin repeat-containing protein [Campylobacteraceae bacterium]
MTYNLSYIGKLSLAVSVVLCSSSNVLANSSVEAIGSTKVSTSKNGATVVGIVAPNKNGLSYNQYNKYNVNKPGLVLNNSLTNGQSVLAGSLNANKNFSNQSASIILNEVISKNPSYIFGQQEIFGQKADNVLVNANGITTKNSGFINTNRAVLTVGSVSIKNGKIHKFDTSGNNNSLNIGRTGLSGSDFLDLMAPKINSLGLLKAKKSVNTISGHNIISADLSNIETVNTNTKLDSYFLGGMKANAINIVSTSKGSGINLSGNFEAENNLSVNDSGSLSLEAALLKAENISLDANNVNIKAKLVENSTITNSDENYTNYRGAIYKNKSNKTQELRLSSLEAKNIKILAENEAYVSAAKLKANNISIKASTVIIESKRITQEMKDTSSQWFYSWVHNSDTKEVKEEQISSSLTASNDILIESTNGDINLKSAKLNASNDVNLKSFNDININASIAKEENKHTVYRKNESASLHTGTNSDSSISENISKTEINSISSINFDAGNDVNILSASLKAKKDINILANKNISIGADSTNSQNQKSDDKTYWGGIGGGSDVSSTSSDTLNHSSDLESFDINLLALNDIKISGSKINAKNDLSVQTSNELIIDNVLDSSESTSSSRNGTIFNITNKSNDLNEASTTSSASNIKAGNTLNLVSLQDSSIIASKIESLGELNITSSKNINIINAYEENNKKENSTALELNTSAQKDGDVQGTASISIKHTAKSSDNLNKKTVSSSIKAGNINLNASNDITITASDLITTKGDASINAENVNFKAAHSVNVDNSTEVSTEVGLSFSGGLEKGRVALAVDHINSDKKKTSKTADVSNNDIAGNFIINASDTVNQEGTVLNVNGSYEINANNLNVAAANDTVDINNTDLSVSVDVGVELDYSGITAPIKDSITKIFNTDIAGNANKLKDSVVEIIDSSKNVVNSSGKSILADGIDILKSANDIVNQDVIGQVKDLASSIKDIKDNLSFQDVEIPEAKVTLDIAVEKSYENSKKINKNVNTVNASNIVINVGNKVTDEASNYISSSDISISANEYENKSVKNTYDLDSGKTTASVGGSVGTSTGVDVSVSAYGKGTNSIHLINNAEAVSGSLSSSNDIEVSANKNVIFEGTDLSSSNGEIIVYAGKDVAFKKVESTKSDFKREYSAGLSIAGSTIPKGSKSISGSVEGSYSDESDKSLSTSGSNISSQNGIAILSSNNLDLEGTNITSDKNIDLLASNNINISSNVESSDKSSQSYSGAISAGGNKGKSGKGSKNFSLELDLEKSNESSKKDIISNITASNNLHTEASKIDFKALEINSDSSNIISSNGDINVEGNKEVNASNSWGFATNINAGTSKKDTSVKSKKTGAIGITVNVGNTDEVIYKNSKINVNDLNIDSHKDLNLVSTSINANNLVINTVGDLNLINQASSKKSLYAKVNAGLAHESQKDVKNDKRTKTTKIKDYLKRLGKTATFGVSFEKD